MSASTSDAKVIMFFGSRARYAARRYRNHWQRNAIIVADYPRDDALITAAHARELARTAGCPVLFVLENATAASIKECERFADLAVFGSFGDTALAIPKSGDAFTVSLAS